MTWVADALDAVFATRLGHAAFLAALSVLACLARLLQILFGL